MPGSYIHTLRYFSGFWARRATPDRVLKILAGGYFDIKRGYTQRERLFRRPLIFGQCGNTDGYVSVGTGIPGGRGPPGRGMALAELSTGQNTRSPLQAVG
ncbi:hypothetical protein OMEGA_183 [Klebsiella phage vB_KaeM_KaOmega]|nr:hypothetical protein OMEGA_183 [Klebsiella phage vB_KaeM_KaOmega]